MIARKNWLPILLLSVGMGCANGKDKGDAASGEVRGFRVVDIGTDTAPTVQLAVQACAGLYNRQTGGSVYIRRRDNDQRWLDELNLTPDEIITDARAFLDTCLAEFPNCVRYAYAWQQRFIPNIITVGAVLGAVPLDEEMGATCSDVVFDATVEFAARNTPYLATRYVYDTYVDHTTGWAMINPGYEIVPQTIAELFDPPIVRDVNPFLVDFVFSQKLFVTFLINGCIRGTEEGALLNEIAAVNPWPKPIGVYGYANNWLVLGGFLFEAQTLCAASRNMGAIPSEIYNLSFFSTRREAITDVDELRPNALEDIDYDPDRTYLAFLVGDGDNNEFIMDSRARWMRQRIEDCAAGEDACPILTWTVSPHLPHLAPDVLQWYYAKSRETGKDTFALPPSGYLYAYPASLEETEVQDRFVAATEEAARILGTRSTVHWEWLGTWPTAEETFLPKYAKRGGPIRGVFPVNVPYMIPILTWKPGQFFKVIEAQDGGKVVLFRPREWRGVDGGGGILGFEKEFFLTPESMAAELGGYPRGTVTGVYMTSDGGLHVRNSVHELVKFLPEHVVLVSADTATRLALEASGSGWEE